MRSKLQNTTVVLLLASYIFVGVAAHSQAISQLLGFGTNPCKVAQTRPTPPAENKVFWTQHKHIPAASKMTGFSPALIVSTECPWLHRYGRLAVSSGVLMRLRLEASTPEPRAPPTA